MHPLLHLIQTANLPLTTLAELSVNELKEFAAAATKMAEEATNKLAQLCSEPPPEITSTIKDNTYWILVSEMEDKVRIQLAKIKYINTSRHVTVRHQKVYVDKVDHNVFRYRYRTRLTNDIDVLPKSNGKWKQITEEEHHTMLLELEVTYMAITNLIADVKLRYIKLGIINK